MTKEEHKTRHEELHRSLDELLADYIGHHKYPRKPLTEISIIEFLTWSASQVKEPTEPEEML